MKIYERKNVLEIKKKNKNPIAKIQYSIHNGNTKWCNLIIIGVEKDLRGHHCYGTRLMNKLLKICVKNNVHYIKADMEVNDPDEEKRRRFFIDIYGFIPVDNIWATNRQTVELYINKKNSNLIKRINLIIKCMIRKIGQYFK
ncbi:MAG: GNAT family N-acetyltransferase [Acholeplasmataceae bacterium]|nr:GNAT family N-acetyltransferase [Acholeplasmataceae bacterium]